MDDELQRHRDFVAALTKRRQPLWNAEHGSVYGYYTDEQIALIGDEQFNALVQAEAAAFFEQRGYGVYDASQYIWHKDPPSDHTLCSRCYAWRRYPPGQRHFGYAGWRVCANDCTCAHHRDEIWIAGSGAA